nr:AraC family transcriptional regulator [Paenibacillus pinihumi]
MAYPKELWEETRLVEKSYPFQLFDNHHPHSRRGENIMHLHWHEHFEIIMIREGIAIFHIDSVPFEVGPGDVLFVPSGGLHVGYNRGDAPVHFQSVVFNSSLFSGWAHDAVHMQFVAPYLEGQLRFPVKPDELHSICREHYELLYRIVEEFQAKEPAYQLMVKSHLHLLFTLLSRAFLPQRLASRPKEQYSASTSRFKTLIHYLDHHYMDKITVEQAARQVNLNPYHFCKTFKKLTGRTFIEYVNMRRINEAERLLRESDLTITEIAGLVGCDNPNYFTKLFKQYKGMTPRAFRG